jgi:hypothetical protein
MHRMHMDCLGRILWVGWLLAGAAHALYLGQGVTAYPVANGAIKVDGRPETIWRDISARPSGTSRIAFSDYEKIVLLEPTEVRNAPPQDYYQAPSTGSVTLLAAYDNAFLYFFFLVQENSTFNPSLCSTADLWKANAVEVYVDPNAWSPTLYSAYFSADAGEASYGTSPKTLQVSKTAWPGDIRRYYRDRKVGDRFELRTPTSQLLAICSTRTRTDGNTLGIEMKVPMPATGDFGAGKSMFISWGYNHYPVANPSSCDSLPIAYRFAKHYKTYTGDPKPPGWVEGDNTHFDPTRSYDGWGRFDLTNSSPVTGSNCRGTIPDSTWDLATWYGACVNSPTATAISRPLRTAWESSAPSFPSPGRDIRGRLSPRSRAGLFILPAAAPLLRLLSP